MNLRDTLLAALKSLPGTREFHIHVLVSSPRKHSALYPFAHPRPKTYLQDILILLSEQVTPDSPRIFVSAIEASLYNIPASSCAILYISKVDSTGQAIAPSPTATLVRSLLTYYADPATRPVVASYLWIHLFARAQNQYLFPNSSEYSGKHPLSDVKLCAWWKRVFSDVATELDTRMKGNSKIILSYVLPGYSELEASHSLAFASSSTVITAHPPHQWIYGHPYSQSDIPLPCPKSSAQGGAKNLGHFIPSFDDDPKSRFMDEIAYTTEADGVKSPERKRPRLASHRDVLPTNFYEKSSEEKEDSKAAKDDRPQGDLGEVTPNEFWERMSFRQECIAGAMTGFFVMGVSSPVSGDTSHSVISPLAPQAGQVSSQLNKRIMTSLLTSHEFATIENSIRATEILENSIKSLCEGLAPSVQPRIASRDSGRQTPERETSASATLAPPRTPPPRIVNGKRAIPEVSPNPFPEPVASFETYHSYIYGSVFVDNPVLSQKASDVAASDKGDGKADPERKVTVLAVRKKKKRTDA